MKHIPNFITSLNLVSGFAAVIFASRGDLLSASWLIAAAMIFDFLDGFSARLLKAYSDIGKELDSLADQVSFGVAPAIIIYKLLSGIHPLAAMTVAAIMPVFAALRLAKFNTDPSQATIFSGMPTPANAIAVITIVIASAYSDSTLINSLAGSPLFLVPFTIILSLLMVSNIPLLSLKTSHLKFRGNEGRYIMILLIVVLLAVCGMAALPFIIPAYIAASLLQRLF